MHQRILFITKRNTTYGFTTHTKKSSGLFNSTRFIVEALSERGIHAKIVEVADANGIDREVSLFRPDKVVVEALFVVPAKWDELKRLHKTVKWYVHLHSNIPFLAMEGIAIEWLSEYVKRGITLICNSLPAYRALLSLFDEKELIYLPNVYLGKVNKKCEEEKSWLDVGCFGAVRPLKNQLIQAMAAIRYANTLGRPLHFHINGTRVEQGGDAVRKNIRELFRVTEHTKLVEHQWLEHADFIHTLRQMDIGLHVSLSETFCVVAADYVTASIPVVASKEIPWLSSFNKASDDDMDDIVSKMGRVHGHHALVRLNQWALKRHVDRAIKLWSEYARDCNV